MSLLKAEFNRCNKFHQEEKIAGRKCWQTTLYKLTSGQLPIPTNDQFPVLLDCPAQENRCQTRFFYYTVVFATAGQKCTDSNTAFTRHFKRISSLTLKFETTCFIVCSPIPKPNVNGYSALNRRQEGEKSNSSYPFFVSFLLPFLTGPCWASLCGARSLVFWWPVKQDCDDIVSTIFSEKN